MGQKKPRRDPYTHKICLNWVHDLVTIFFLTSFMSPRPQRQTTKVQRTKTPTVKQITTRTMLSGLYLISFKFPNSYISFNFIILITIMCYSHFVVYLCLIKELINKMFRFMCWDLIAILWNFIILSRFCWLWYDLKLWFWLLCYDLKYWVCTVGEYCLKMLWAIYKVRNDY